MAPSFPCYISGDIHRFIPGFSVVIAFANKQLVLLRGPVQVHEVEEKKEPGSEPIHDQGWVGGGLTIGEINYFLPGFPGLPIVSTSSQNNIDVPVPTQVVA
jgi:hypothetical protein